MNEVDKFIMSTHKRNDGVNKKIICYLQSELFKRVSFEDKVIISENVTKIVYENRKIK